MYAALETVIQVRPMFSGRAGRRAGFAVLLLDVSKAAAPVGIAYFNLGMRGAAMFLIAIAPILGHAFSPFLGFRGGKALPASFGVWINRMESVSAWGDGGIGRAGDLYPARLGGYAGPGLSRF